MRTTNLLLLFLLQFLGHLSFGQSAIQDTIQNRLDRAQAMVTYNPDAALELIKETLDFSINQNSKYGEWKSNDALGFFYLKQNQMDKGVKVHQKNVIIAQELDSLKLEGLSTLRLGVLFMRLKRLEEAQNKATQALNIFKKINNRSNEARALSNLGSIKINRTLSEEGLNDFLAAYKIFEEIGEDDMKSQMNLNISYYYLMNGQGEAALPYVKRSLEHTLKLQDPDLIARSYGNLAYAYSLIGDYHQAFKNYQYCIDTSQKYHFT